MYVYHQPLPNEAALNLAIEETLLGAVDDDLFMLWRDRPSVIIGRNQNVYAEVDLRYTEEHGISVVRRLSGGGAVYHDDGNLCYTYIALHPGGTMGDHAAYIDMMVASLRRIGVPAAREGRNDISAEGRKISGNAQYAKVGRLCHHGTLLFDTDVATMKAALTPEAAKVQSRGIASVAARVANIKEYLPHMTTKEFADSLIDDILKNAPSTRLFEPTDDILAESERLANARYRNHDWTYGGAPRYNYQNAKRFPGGSVEVRLAVERGVIQNAALFGDFLSLRDTAPLTEALRGVSHHHSDIRGTIEPLFSDNVLGSVTLDEFLSLF